MIQKGRQTGIYFTSLPTFLRRIRKAFKECLVFAPDKSRQDKQRNQNQKQFHFFIFFLMGLCVGLRTSRKFAGSNKERCLANRRCFRCAYRFCYFNPRSREGSDQCEETLRITITVISIHAPREGSDPARSVDPGEAGISIHAPREGSDLAQDNPAAKNTTFQSTLPARGATRLHHRVP